MNAAQLRVIDALVAEHVMGWKRDDSGLWREDHDNPPPQATFTGADWSPSTDIAAAWEVVEHIHAAGYQLRLNDATDTIGGWYARFYRYPDATKIAYTNAPTSHLAICLAALAAKGIDTDAAIKEIK